jgi:hypothetical protein
LFFLVKLFKLQFLYIKYVGVRKENVGMATREIKLEDRLQDAKETVEGVVLLREGYLHSCSSSGFFPDTLSYPFWGSDPRLPSKEEFEDAIELLETYRDLNGFESLLIRAYACCKYLENQ